MMDFKLVLLTTLLSPVTVLPLAHAKNAMDEIVVTATRYPRDLSAIGSSISVITAADMAKSQTVFVQNILQNIPGLSLNQNGAYGGVSSIRIRGASTAQTMVLVDGIQINDVSAPSGGYNFANLDPNGIERIEVLRGPQSILYGSDAIGGVINIITDSGRRGFGGSLFAEGGSFNTYRAGGHIAGGSDKVNFSLSGSGITSGGISKADEDNGNKEADSYRNISLQGKVTTTINENNRLQLISRYVDSRTETDSFGFANGLFMPVDGNVVDYSTEFLIAGRGFFDFGGFKNTLSVEYSTTNRHNKKNGIDNFKARGQRFTLDYFGHYRIDDAFGISFGAQHKQTRAETASPKKFTINSIFSELSWQGMPGLTLTAGLRYDHHSQYGSTTTPRITAAYYIPTTNSKIFANWGRGFKAPSIFQLTYICGFCGLTAPNFTLKPERSKGWEVGIEQTFRGDSISLGATYFHQNITDMINFDFAVGYGNIDNVLTRGVELSFAAKVTDSLSIRGNYTFTNATDNKTGKLLVRVPRNTAFGEIQWQATPSLNLMVAMTYNGKETDSFSPGTKGWTRVDLKASYDLANGVELYGRVDNLLNKEYQQVFGYGTPDRAYHAGLRGKF